MAHGALTAGVYVVGIDLAGPSNAADTALVWFQERGEQLRKLGRTADLDDRDLARHVGELAGAGPVAVGLDAPLSYNQGGGLRPGDVSLRTRIRAAGLPASSVTAPTVQRTAHSTLRGVCVARWLGALESAHPIRIVETHPGAALRLGGAPLDDVVQLGSSPAARLRLAAWLDDAGLKGIPADLDDHALAACGAALAAWRWSQGRPSWLHRAAPPEHPFDYAC